MESAAGAIGSVTDVSNGNSVTLVGNCTRDPELRFTASGQATASFGLAVNRRWQNRQTSEWEEAVSYFTVVSWRELAENVAESVHKGTRVIVTGRLDQRSWETPDGQKKSTVEITADEVGPSLRWASAHVTRNERRGGDGERSGGERSGAERSGGDRAAMSRPASNEPPQDYGYDEEPF